MNRSGWASRPGPTSDAGARDGGPERDDLEGEAAADAGAPAGDGDAARGDGALAGDAGPRCARVRTTGRWVRLEPLSRSVHRPARPAVHARLGPRGRRAPRRRDLAAWATSRDLRQPCSTRWRDDLRRAARAHPAAVLRRALEGRHHRRRAGRAPRHRRASRSRPRVSSTSHCARRRRCSTRTSDFIRVTLEQYPTAARHAALEMIHATRVPGSVCPAAPLRARTSGPSLARGVLPPLDAAGRAGPGRLGLASGRSAVGNARAGAVVLRDGAVVVARDLRALRARPDARELLALPRRARSTRFGGVPRALLYDNLKTAVLERAGRPHSLPSPPARARRPLPLRPQAVRAVRGATRRAGSSARSATCANPSSPRARSPPLDDLNAQLADWIERVAHARVVPGGRRRASGRRRARRGAAAPAAAARASASSPTSCGHCVGQNAVRPLRPQRLLDPAHPRREAAHPRRSETVVRVLDGDARGRSSPALLRRGRQHRGRRRHLDALADREAPRARAPRPRPALRRVHARRAVPRPRAARRTPRRHDPRLLRLLDQYGAPALDAALAEAHAARRLRRRSPSRTSSTSGDAPRGAPSPSLARSCPTTRASATCVVTPHARSVAYDALARSGDKTRGRP